MFVLGVTGVTADPLELHAMIFAQLEQMAPQIPVRATKGQAIVAGLYVGDGSIFPTGIGVNPMVTIMAMARRLSRVIRAET